MHNKIDVKKDFELPNKEYHRETLIIVILDLIIGLILFLVCKNTIQFKIIIVAFLPMIIGIIFAEDLPVRIVKYFEDKMNLEMNKKAYKDSREYLRKDKLEKIDFKNDNSYFRDILEKYSPSELAYIDEFKTNETYKLYVMTLLKLELKKIIKINESYIDVLNDKAENLKPSEKYVLSKIKNGLIVIEDDEIYDYVKEEAVEDKLIDEQKKKSSLSFNIKFLLKFLLLCAYIIIFPFISVHISFEVLSIFLWCFYLIVLIVTFFYPVYIYNFNHYYSINYLNDHYKRSDIGSEINYKLEGLKNYIKDFGNLSDREKDELTIWEDYLIYSVMFNINTTIYNEMDKFIIFNYKKENS